MPFHWFCRGRGKEKQTDKSCWSSHSTTAWGSRKGYSTGIITLIPFLPDPTRLWNKLSNSPAWIQCTESSSRRPHQRDNYLPDHLWWAVERQIKVSAWQFLTGMNAHLLKRNCKQSGHHPFQPMRHIMYFLSCKSDSNTTAEPPHQVPEVNDFCKSIGNLHVLQVPFLQVECCHISGDWCQLCSHPWSHRSSGNHWR